MFFVVQSKQHITYQYSKTYTEFYISYFKPYVLKFEICSFFFFAYLKPFSLGHTNMGTSKHSCIIFQVQT